MNSTLIISNLLSTKRNILATKNYYRYAIHQPIKLGKRNINHIGNDKIIARFQRGYLKNTVLDKIR